MTVRVVTDSSCDLPPDLVARAGIEIVPLTIRFGSEELVDLVDLTPSGFWSRLATSSDLPQTAAPSAGAFEAKFRSLFEAGATGIVCINLSSKLSATMQSARVAADAVADLGPVEVVDSLTVSMGLGTLCLEAAAQAAAGQDLASIVADVVDRRERTRIYATLDTLEFLKRGGRIGNARALLGSMLSIKPIIEISGGEVEEAGKVRTRSRALRTLADRAAAAPIEKLSVLHGNAVDLDALLDMLAPVCPRDQIVTGLVGPVIGTHAGPGVIGVAFQVCADSP